MTQHRRIDRIARTIRSAGSRLAICAALVATATLAGCKPAGGGNAATGGQAQATPAPSQAQPAGNQRVRATPTGGVDASLIGTGGQGAILAFARTHHDFGRITDTQTYETSFSFTNTGTQTLQIQTVKASCGCTVPTLPKFTFEPGESGDIAVVFDPNGKSGVGTKKMTVLSNAANGRSIEVTFGHDIGPMVTPESKFLRMSNARLHQESKQTLTMWYTDPDLRVEDVSINNPGLSAELIEYGVVDSESNGEAIYRLVVEVTLHDDCQWGTLYATRLKTRVHARPLEGRDPIIHEYTTFIQGTVFGEISCTTSARGRRETPSSVVSLGAQMRRNTTFSESVTLRRNSGAPFNVVSTRVRETPIPDVRIDVADAGAGAYRVTISGNTGSYVGDVRGTVEIVTDVPGEGPLIIRFAGRVSA